jgi:NTE family protein
MGRGGKERVSEENGEKMAVVLSGGGAYGAYEVGVMKALLGGEMKGAGYRPLDPEIFTGTSVGSFNASLMVAQPGVPGGVATSRVEQIWLNDVAEGIDGCGNGVFRFRGNPLQYLDYECVANPANAIVESNRDALFLARGFLTRGLNFLATQGSFVNRVLQFIDASAFISVEPFRDMLRRTIRSEALRNSEKILRVVATNWVTGEVKTFENEHIANEEFGPLMIMASAAIPGIFPPVRIGDDFYVDGGAVMNTPLNCAIKAGATTLFVIYLDPDVGNIPLQRLMNTIDTIDRVYTIMLATKINEDVETAAWINAGLTVLQQVDQLRTAANLSREEITAFIRVAAQIATRLKEGRAYRKLTIHRFHPRDDLGGPLGMLDFSREAIVRLIARGFEDAVYHDCYESKCVFPDAAPPTPEYMGTAWLQTAL